MQEEFVKKVKRTAKKFAAAAISAGMVGATVAGAAFAANLSGLPAPFVSSGAFDAYIAVGANAKPIDVAGAVEVATAFGQLATTSSGTSGTATLEVNYTTGEAFTSLTLNASAVNTLLGSTLARNHTGGATDSWTSATNADNITVLANVTKHIGSQDIVSGATLAFNENGFLLNPDGLGVTVNKSDATNKVITWTLGTNRTGTFAGLFAVGDDIAWLGTGYEITASDGQNVTLGSTSTVEVTVGGEFVVGSTTFTLDDLSTDAASALISTGGTSYTINSTYLTIGSEKLKLHQAFVGTTNKKATFKTIAESHKFKSGDAFPLSTNWVVDTLSFDASNNVTSFIVRNNLTYSVSEGGQVEIVSGLNLIYNNNTKGSNVEYIVVYEQNQTVQALLDGAGDGTGGNGIIDANSSAWPPGIKWVTNLNSIETVWNGTALTEPLYLKVGDNYELKITNSTAGTVLAYLPSSSLNYTASGGSFSGSQMTNGQTHVTPSGVNVTANATAVTIRVKTVAITIDADGILTAGNTSYFARDGSSKLYQGTTEYSSVVTERGAKITWDDSNDIVSIKEPKGDTLTIDMAFDSTSGASYFNKASDIDFKGSDITTYGTNSTVFKANATYPVGANVAGTINTTYDVETTYKSNIWLIDGYTAGTGVAWGWDKEVGDIYGDDVVVFRIYDRTLSMTSGTKNAQEVTLSAGENTTVGTTGIKLLSSAGESVTINKVTPGFAMLDSDINTASLGKPLIAVGGSAVNSVVKSLVDSGSISYADLIAMGSSGYAQLDFVEAAFNSKDVFVIAGLAGEDTLMAARAVAASLLNSAPVDFSAQDKAVLMLNTGTTVVSDIAIVTPVATNETA